MATSWIEMSTDCQFPIDNLPYGSFSVAGGDPHIGVAIGNYVLDLANLSENGCVENHDGALSRPTLGGLFDRGRRGWSDLRNRLIELLTDSRHERLVTPALVPRGAVQMHMPFEVGDYVDFYSFRHHAENLGRILRPNGDVLLPNWKHLPVGYHGRSGTVVVSGTPVVRPKGQRKDQTVAHPTFGPTKKLDIEAEVGFVVGTGTDLGRSLTSEEFEDHVFGVVLVNDWSARDLQAWEYVPLGPFLGKSFLTSISPWVVTLDALSGARTASPLQDPKPLDYLVDSDPWSLQIDLEISINGHVVSRPPFSEMYWTPGQQLAHMTSNGANIRPGDLYASGTVSGPEPSQWGSLMELTWNGTKPLQLSSNSTLRFLQDGDSVTITASAPARSGSRIGFGSVVGTIVGCDQN